MDTELEQMARDLTLGGYAERTKRDYLQVASKLQERFGRPAGELEREQLRLFVEELDARGNSRSWFNGKVAALRFLYCRTLGRPEVVSFIKCKKVNPNLPAILSVQEVHRFLNAIETPQYQAVAMVIYGAGLRISEAVVLETRDIDAARGVIRVRNGKGDKPREVNLSSSLYRWLRRYWSRYRPPAPYLFGSHITGKPISKRHVQKVFADVSRQLKGKKVTPHLLRHCFATHLLEEGTDYHVVSALLGHSSVKSTAYYTRMTRKVIRRAPSPLDLLPQSRV